MHNKCKPINVGAAIFPITIITYYIITQNVRSFTMWIYAIKKVVTCLCYLLNDLSKDNLCLIEVSIKIVA